MARDNGDEMPVWAMDAVSTLCNRQLTGKRRDRDSVTGCKR